MYYLISELRKQQQNKDIKMTQDQKTAYNELAQLLMDNLGYTSEQAVNSIEKTFELMFESLNEGILK